MVIIFSVNVTMAADLNDTDNDIGTDLNMLSDDDSLEISEDAVPLENSLSSSVSLENNDVTSNYISNDISTSYEDYIIYIGKNITEDGNGSAENPFATFDLACNSIAEEKNSVIINVGEGVYNLNSRLLFNTNNLYINATSNNVVIKNNPSGFFELNNSGGNFSVSNIMIDGYYTDVPNTLNYIFKGLTANLVTFNNCTFKECWGFLYYDFSNVSPQQANFEPYFFNNCKFLYELFAVAINPMDGVNFRYVTFKNSIFNIKNMDRSFSGGASGTLSGHSTNFEDCWFGINSLPKMFYKNGKLVDYNITKYAIFSAYESYLGNCNYEITGKLIWNDTTTEGFENLNPMTVILSSDTGELDQTAILKNGTFKVIYTSTSPNHKINITLDNELQSVEFQSINLSLDSPIITYGDKQNITVTLPTEYNGVIYVTVNGKTYNKTLELNNVVTIDISDVLPVGTYDVNITFIDKIDNETCAIYGFNTTTITVAKVSNYDFDATITPTTVYVGDNATITLSLPSGATGNVSVKVGDAEAKTFNSDDEINIDGFISGNNVVNITFISDIYDAKSVVKNVIASAKPTTITTVNVTTNYNVAKDLIITLTDVNGNVLANKTVNVVVGTLNKNLTTNASGQVSVDISTLAPNNYVANIAFAGDDLYAKSNATANVVVNKIASSLTAPAVTATYNVGKNLVITLTANGKALANQKVTVKVGSISKTLTTDAKGQVSVDVSKLTPKTYTATFTYAGDDINDISANTAKVVVNKATPKITAKKATFKAKKKTKKYSIVLKDNKGKAIKKAKLTLKVKGKTYKATTNAKGKATFKITKLTKKGKHNAVIKFKGNNYYKASSKKVKLTIKK